jgi:hypothetical protein
MEERYPEPYKEYLVLFHGERDYFECHEVLEEYWREDPRGPRSRLWVGLIQIAVALYHERRGNAAGARKLLRKAISLLKDGNLASIGIDRTELMNLLEERLQELERTLKGGREGPPVRETSGFQDLNLPLSDPALMQECVRRCRERGCVWGAPSRIDRRELTHKHMLRDRSEVIRLRREALERNLFRRGNGKAGRGK